MATASYFESQTCTSENNKTIEQTLTERIVSCEKKLEKMKKGLEWIKANPGFEYVKEFF